MSSCLCFTVITSAVAVFDSIFDHGLEPDFFTYSHMTNTLLKSVHRHNRKAARNQHESCTELLRSDVDVSFALSLFVACVCECANIDSVT